MDKEKILFYANSCAVPVCKELIAEHDGIKNFTSGFGEKKTCGCEWCVMAQLFLDNMAERG